MRSPEAMEADVETNAPIHRRDSSTVILVRTHFVDDMVEGLAERLRRETGWPVCLMLDRVRGGDIDPGANEHIDLTTKLLENLGLFVTHDALWRCGDYALYAARQRYARTEFFWMIEPDVRVNLRDFGDFFHLFARHPEYDLLATHLGIADESYPWTAMMRPFAPRPSKCMFPIVRLSGRALDYLIECRREMGRRFMSEVQPDGTLRSQDAFPNDEVFTATELSKSDFLCGDINDTGIEFYNNATFNFAFPQPDRRLRELRPDGKIYHPVDKGSEYIRKVRGRFEHIRNNGGPAAFIRDLFERPELIDNIQMECGPEESARFAADVEEAIRRLS
jgi:hypothetical protein